MQDDVTYDIHPEVLSCGRITHDYVHRIFLTIDY